MIMRAQEVVLKKDLFRDILRLNRLELSEYKENLYRELKKAFEAGDITQACLIKAEIESLKRKING